MNKTDFHPVTPPDIIPSMDPWMYLKEAFCRSMEPFGEVFDTKPRKLYTVETEEGEVREAPCKDDACSNGILPNSISTPPPQANGRFVAGIFRRKLANSLKQRF